MRDKNAPIIQPYYQIGDDNMSKLQKYTEEWLEDLCKNSTSYAEVLRKAGRKPSGGNHSYLKQAIEKFEIDVSHFTGKSWSNVSKINSDCHNKYTPEEIFIENSLVTRKVARRYIISHNLIPYQCSECGNKGEWRGKEMALELDHINGINNDHRLTNLRWLCPNCHAITDTYAGKNNLGL